MEPNRNIRPFAKRKSTETRVIMIVSVLAAVSLFIAADRAEASVFTVPGDSPTIQGAIDMAADGDEIVVSPGTYDEFDITFDGKAVTVRSTDPDNSAIVSSTVVDADRSGSVFRFVSGEGNGSVLAGLTITGGAASGGGARCDGSSPVIERCAFVGNTAGSSFWKYGGGIYCTGASAVIRECYFTGNEGDWGGAIRISEGSTGLVEDCVITGNSAFFDGAGIDCFESSPEVTGCTISNNEAGYGGGLYCAESASPVFRNCTFTGNDARWGGALYISMCDPQFYNCLIENNTGLWGGGVHCFTSYPLLENCTITGNTAIGAGGALYCWGAADPGLVNCILWDNSPGEIFILTGDAHISFSDVEGGYAGEGNIDATPQFITWFGFSSLLRPGSPCVDAGDTALEDAVYDSDPRWPQGFPDGPRSDMGAYGGPGNGGWLK